MPVESLGAKSSIVMTSRDIRKTGEMLQARGVAFEDGDGLSLTDPDGNKILVVPQDGFARSK